MGNESPDILAARKVAKHLNTEHHEVIFSGDDATSNIRNVIKALESYDITTIRASIGRNILLNNSGVTRVEIYFSNFWLKIFCQRNF